MYGVRKKLISASWGDLLTSYDGQTITYDTIGNPLSYYNGNRWTFNWENGRELATMTKAGVTWTNTYDANGMRTGRTNGTTYYEYVYDGSTLSQMRFGANVLDFIYGAEGTPLAVIYGGSYYYYVTNAQGDVVALLNSSGNTVVTYTYDAWGNPISTTGTMAAILGTLNPLRYRGYVYDTETGLYYLQSRYYDPTIGRFLNADSLVSTGQGLLGNNMFTYCGNNPVSRVDPTGNLFGTIVGIVAVVALVFSIPSSQNQEPIHRQNAQNKYNENNVKVYERTNPPTEKGMVNAEIYYPDEEISNINIDNSLSITSKYEQEAILDVIIASPYYDEEIYGDTSFMQAQWVAHNISHNIASSGALGFWVMQWASGAEDPIVSSTSLDLRSKNNFLRRQKALYTVISWFY